MAAEMLSSSMFTFTSWLTHVTEVPTLTFCISELDAHASPSKGGLCDKLSIAFMTPNRQDWVVQINVESMMFGVEGALRKYPDSCRQPAE